MPMKLMFDLGWLHVVPQQTERNLGIFFRGTFSLVSKEITKKLVLKGLLDEMFFF